MGPKQSVNFESAADYAYILNERDTKNEDLPTSYVSAGSMINHWACRLAWNNKWNLTSQLVQWKDLSKLQ